MLPKYERWNWRKLFDNGRLEPEIETRFVCRFFNLQFDQILERSWKRSKNGNISYSNMIFRDQIMAIRWNTCFEPELSFQNLLILALDWQLGSRTILWETTKCGNSSRCSESALQGFQRDLHSLRRLAELVPWLQNR